MSRVMKRWVSPLSLCILMGVTGCAGLSTRSEPPQSQPQDQLKTANSAPERTGNQQVVQTDIHHSENQEIIDMDKELGAVIPTSPPATPTPALPTAQTTPASPIPIEINREVAKWIHYFTVQDRERFQRFLTRGEIYRELVQGILRQNAVPTDLYYLGMIESGYVTHARSHAKAVGIWQFIRGTSSRYGLATNAYVDERKDPVRASNAAARYLRDLHEEFSSWYLAMAAYNSGEGRVRRAIRRGNTRDFWTLVRRRFLPNETMNYVPKFLAALVIGRHPERYGFAIIPPEKYPRVEGIAAPSGVRLGDVAEIAGIDEEKIRELNPGFRRGVTPPGKANYLVWVPETKAKQARANLAVLEKRKVAGLPSVRSLAAYDPEERTRSAKPPKSRHYRVRPGDSLEEIAKRFRLSVNRLKRLNGLRQDRIFMGQYLRIADAS